MCHHVNIWGGVYVTISFVLGKFLRVDCFVCRSLARDWYGDLLKIGDFQLTDTDFKQKNLK